MNTFSNRKSVVIGDFEITTREIIFSLSIFSIMMVIGLLISNTIRNHQLDTIEEYNKAVKISDSEQFQYGMDTNIGNAFVYGDLIAERPVTYEELDDEYLYIEKVKEKYTKHTRHVTYTDSKGKRHTRTETYWSWDVQSRQDQECYSVTFLGISFPTIKFKLPSKTHITTIKESSDIRYQYYGIPKQMTGTIYTKLYKKNISDKSKFTQKSLSDTVEEYTTASSVGIIIFWVFWIILIISGIIGFYYLENRWLY